MIGFQKQTLLAIECGEVINIADVFGDRPGVNRYKKQAFFYFWLDFPLNRLKISRSKRRMG